MSIIRDVTLKAKKYLTTDEILLFIGSRQAGKTTILRQLEQYIGKNQPHYYLTLEDKEYKKLLDQNPKNIFKILPLNNKKTYLFIDEIQYLLDPTNFLKLLYDQYKDKIKLIVSGSSAFYIDKKFTDSLAGRKKIFFVYTASFREFLRFKNQENLLLIPFNKHSLINKEKLINKLYEYMIYGGYPRVIKENSFEEKKEILRDLAYSYVKKDMIDSGIKSDETFYQLLKILAQRVGNLVNVNELATNLSVSRTMIANYFYIMEKSFHLRLVKPLFKNFRKEITKMPKVYFYDNGLRNFFCNNFDNLLTRVDRGQILENTVFRQLIEQYYIEDIKFWRTVDNSEIDFVINKNAYEVKNSINNIKASKYKNFKIKYPDIKLQYIDVNNLLNSFSF